MESWVLELFVLLNAATFLIAFGTAWIRSRNNDSGTRG